MTELTRREKRLISAMNHGIYIRHQDGHRWIECGEDDYGFHQMMRMAGLHVNNKIYGGVDEALDVIDDALTRASYLTLEADFDVSFDEEDVVCKSSYASNRIDETTKGNGGLA